MLYFKLLCMRYSLKKILIGFGAVLLSFSAIGCQNDDYLQDGGKHNPYYNGTVLDYLEQHPDKHYFSDLVEMIHYAGMDSVFQNGEITFFAPTDWSIRFSVDYLSKKLYFTMGEDSVRDLRQIKPDTDHGIVADMYSIMGDLYYSNGLKDSAFIAYDSCLVYNPENVGCLNNYAYYLSLEKKDLDKAEEMSHRTIVAEPGNKTYIDTYAWILFIKGKYAEAKLYMDRVLVGDIENDEEVSGGVLEHAGDIYAQCGDMEGALKYWKMAQEKGGDVSQLLKKKIQLKKYIEE
jgi:tetratricopeptide (TPR) repeat protein